MRLALWIALGVAAPPGLAAQALELRDVLESVERNYPPLLIALQEKDIAEADVLAALGRFDLAGRARFDSNRLGLYDYQTFDAGVEQPFAFQGMSATAGWSRGTGDVPGYLGGLLTRSSGEYRAGVRAPLFRDREIDARRADLERARLGVRLAELSIAQQRLAIIQLATRRYWDWVAAGRRQAVVAQLLEIASARDKQLRDAAALGQIPDFDVLDNERAILNRRGALIEAERAQQQAALELSLFLRDATGNPLVAGVERTPPEFPEPVQLSDDKLNEDIEAAIARRPDLERVARLRAQTDVERRLAKNQRLPGIDFGLNFFQDTGSTRRVLAGPQELRTSLSFELPFQRRNATGRVKSAEARIAQLDRRERFTRDLIVTEVRDARSAVAAAHRRAVVARREVETTKRVEEGERARFELGDTNLFTLNLRELATAEAGVREVTAFADLQRAHALYELAIARALDKPQTTP